jgi:hypothetical protein
MDEKPRPEVDRFFEDCKDQYGGAEPRPLIERSIVEQLAPSLAPVKRLPSHIVLTLQFLVAFAACALAIVTVTGWMGLHFMTGVQITGMTFVLTLSAILFASRVASQMVPGARQLPLAGLLAFSGITLFGVMALLFPWSRSAAFMPEGLSCGVTEFATALPAIALFWFLTRRGAAFDGAGLGAVLSALAGILGLTVTQMQCMFPNPEHLLVWHGGVAVLMVVAGSIIGSMRITNSMLKWS